MVGRLERTQNIVLCLRMVSSQQKKRFRVALSSIIFFPSLPWKIKNKTVQMVIMNTCVSAQNKYEHMWIFFIFASDLSFKNLFSDWSLQCASAASSYPSLPPWRYRCRQLVCVYVPFYVISSDKTSIYCLYLLSAQPCFCFWDLSAFCGIYIR